jgi:hypothetical protein
MVLGVTFSITEQMPSQILRWGCLFIVSCDPSERQTDGLEPQLHRPHYYIYRYEPHSTTTLSAKTGHKLPGPTRGLRACRPAWTHLCWTTAIPTTTTPAISSSKVKLGDCASHGPVDRRHGPVSLRHRLDCMVDTNPSVQR